MLVGQELVALPGELSDNVFDVWRVSTGDFLNREKFGLSTKPDMVMNLC